MKRAIDIMFWVVFAMTALTIVAQFAIGNVSSACAWICSMTWMFIARAHRRDAEEARRLLRELIDETGEFLKTLTEALPEVELIRVVRDKWEENND